MNTQLAAPTAQGYFRRILREVRVWDVIVLGILPATIEPFVAHALSPQGPNWTTYIAAAAISYVGFFVAYCLWMIAWATAKLLRENDEEIRSLREFKAANSERKLFFFSPGLAVWLNRGTGKVVINLHILSTECTELIFIKIVLSDNRGINITCEHSEPIAIDKFDLTAKTIEQKVTPQELEAFQKGQMVNLNGYAKFRDKDNRIRVEQITLSTIPNV